MKATCGEGDKLASGAGMQISLAVNYAHLLPRSLSQSNLVSYLSCREVALNLAHVFIILQTYTGIEQHRAARFKCVVRGR